MRNPLYDWWHAKHIPHFCPTCYYYQAVNYTEPYDPTKVHSRFCQLSGAIKVEANHCVSWKYEPVVEYRKNYGKLNTVKGGRPSGKARVCTQVGIDPPDNQGNK